MTQITRHPSGAYENGQTIGGERLETDIGNIVAVVNGDLGDDNLAADADLDGAKIADGTITGEKILDGAISTAKLAAAAVTNENAVANTSGQTISSTSYTTVDSVALTLTGQPVLLLYCCDLTGAGTDTGSFEFTRDATVLQEWTGFGYDTNKRLFSALAIDTSGTTGAATLAAKAKKVGSANFTLANRVLIAIEFKR